MHIRTVSDFRTAARIGRYAWPGGYPLYFICDDGGALCHDCVRNNRRQILGSVAHGVRDGWRVVAQDVNWENDTLVCDNCSERIESAYAD